MNEEPLSKELLQRSFLFGKEHFWKYEDAIKVVSELTKDYYAVIGVELYEQVGDAPRWLATSNYMCEETFPWDAYVKNCEKAAINFIKSNKINFNTLFNFSFISEQERRF
jgi:hypothetical protein